MAVTITAGYTFGTTESVTAAKLADLVNLATISGITASEATSVLTSIVAYNNDVVCYENEVIYST